MPVLEKSVSISQRIGWLWHFRLDASTLDSNERLLKNVIHASPKPSPKERALAALVL